MSGPHTLAMGACPPVKRRESRLRLRRALRRTSLRSPQSFTPAGRGPGKSAKPGQAMAIPVRNDCMRYVACITLQTVPGNTRAQQCLALLHTMQYCAQYNAAGRRLLTCEGEVEALQLAQLRHRRHAGVGGRSFAARRATRQTGLGIMGGKTAGRWAMWGASSQAAMHQAGSAGSLGSASLAKRAQQAQRQQHLRSRRCRAVRLGSTSHRPLSPTAQFSRLSPRNCSGGSSRVSRWGEAGEVAAQR
jgi:hypothetical protein